jgi:hypothetical protein
VVRLLVAVKRLAAAVRLPVVLTLAELEVAALG